MKSMRFSDAEWRVMQVLWQHAPVTARDILEHLGPKAEWAYTTVKTMLTRLVAKGAVGEELRANVAIYQPKVTRLSARRSAVRSLVDRAFGGAYGAFVHHLIEDEKLTPRERARVKKMLTELGRDDAERGQ